MSPYAAIVAVGPGPLEVARLRDLTASLAYHEPGGTLIVIDDVPASRDLAEIATAPGRLDVRVIHHRRRDYARTFVGGKGICSAIMTGLRAAQGLATAFTLKLDTDSLVIAPFRERIVARLARWPEVGMIGAYRISPVGTARDWTMHERPIARLSRRWTWPRRDMPPAEARAHVRRLVQAARHHGYTPGEHCLGGGYALSRTALDRMAARGWLDGPSLWEAIDLPEDVAVGLHVRAAGLTFADDVAVGDVFGVCHVGLPFPPDLLVDRGYAVIHAVKNDRRLSEQDIRAFFAGRRGQTLAAF